MDLSSLSCEKKRKKKPPNFNFGVYNVLEVTDYGHFVLKNPVTTHCNISETDHCTGEKVRLHLVNMWELRVCSFVLKSITWKMSRIFFFFFFFAMFYD